MKISLEQNSGKENEAYPYQAHIQISTITVDFDTDYRVPIQERKNGKTTYTAEVCGFQVEGGSPDVVMGLIERLVPRLVNLARLPTYVFIARRSHKMYPVYTYGDKVFATTEGGPLFEHIELAKVREYLSDYMHTTGALGTPGKSEKLHVRGVHPRTLKLIRPLLYLKKRPVSGDDNEFWAPVFPTGDESAIYTYAASGKRQVEVDQGRELFRLRSQVAQALIADKRLKDEYDLRADRLLPDYWEKVKPSLKKLSSKLVYDGVEMDMYQEGMSVVAVEHRQTENRYSFYVGKGAEGMRERAAADLVRRGIISDPNSVTIK